MPKARQGLKSIIGDQIALLPHAFGGYLEVHLELDQEQAATVAAGLFIRLAPRAGVLLLEPAGPITHFGGFSYARAPTADSTH